VTSGYLEGDQNEPGEWAYNRDKKRGKKQVVIGLLCDGEDDPISITVFKGNTADI
jgi:transposase